MAETRLDKLKETIDDKQAKIGDRIRALLLLLRSKHSEGENLQVDSIPTSLQLPESPDFNRPDPKPNYVINASTDVTKASSPLPNRTIKCHRRISLEEIEERRLKGLCLFCEESETPDHYLLHKNSGILMIDCDEDQSCDDEELVEIEVATESNGIEVNNQRQFQVPVSDSEILGNIELREEKSVLENLEYVVLNKNLEQGWVQKNVNKRFEVDVDVDRDQKVTSNTQIGSTHQMLDKMPLRVRSKMRRKQPRLWMQNNSEPILILSELERKKKKLCLKTWMFKYKYVEEGVKRLHNQLRYKCLLELEERFKIWSRRESWRKHKEVQQFMATKEEMEEGTKENDQKQRGDWGHYFLLFAAANRSHLWSTSYHVWHRWKARCVFVEMISTMRAWLFGEEGFDIGK